MRSKRPKTDFNIIDRLPIGQCTAIRHFRQTSSLILMATLVAVSTGYSPQTWALSNSCRSLFTNNYFDRILPKAKSNKSVQGQPSDIAPFISGLQTSSVKLKSILNPKFTMRYWDSAESVLIAQKFKLVFDALDEGFVERLTPDRYFEFETEQLSGAFSIYFEGSSSAKNKLIIDIQEIRIKANGRDLNDGESTGALSSQFAKLMVSITRALFETRNRYHELTSVQLTANVVNPRLRTSLIRLGFTEQEIDSEVGSYWAMQTLLSLH